MNRQEEYQNYETLRRFGGSLTLGRTGDKFDRDGDGQLDDALESESLSDITTWELRFRVWGSRDARDERYAGRFRKLAQDTREARLTALAALGQEWSRYVTDPQTQQPVINANGFFCTFAVKRFLADPAHASAVTRIREIARHDKTLADLSTQLQKEVEQAPIVTLVYGGTQRKDQFGPDKKLVALRGAFGAQDHGYTFNLEYSKIDGLLGAPDPTVYKAGAEWAWLAMKGRVGSGKNSGLRISASGAWEKSEDVPNAKHDSIAKLNVKVDWPLNDYISLPISVTWANHADLLTDEKETRGFIGFTVDTSSLLDSKKNNPN